MAQLEFPQGSPYLGFRAQGLGIRLQGQGFKGFRFRVWGSGGVKVRDWGAVFGCRLKDVWFRV